MINRLIPCQFPYLKWYWTPPDYANVKWVASWRNEGIPPIFSYPRLKILNNKSKRKKLHVEITWSLPQEKDTAMMSKKVRLVPKPVQGFWRVPWRWWFTVKKWKRKPYLSAIRYGFRSFYFASRCCENSSFPKVPFFHLKYTFLKSKSQKQM